MGFIIRQEDAWLQSRQSPVSKSTVPAQCQQRVSRFSMRCKVEFITSNRWLSSSMDLPKDSTRLASRSMELSFLVGCTSRYLQGSFCSLQDWQAALPSHFCFRLRHSSHAVAVRLAFCRGCAWLGVMGTAGYFAIRGPKTRGGGVDGSLQDEAALLTLPNESFAVCGKLSDMWRWGVPVKVYMVWSGGRYPSST